MKRILCLSGSRADYGLLEWPVKVLKEAFDARLISLNAKDPADAFYRANVLLGELQPDCLLILGDRWEILQAAIAAHLRRVPIAHIGGGDVSLGSYDHSMRDCISLLSQFHFPTSEDAAMRLDGVFLLTDVHMVGNVALDYILNGDWLGARPISRDYVVVSYQVETIDGTIDWKDVIKAVGNRFAVFIRPNEDAGSNRVNGLIDIYAESIPNSCDVIESLSHGEFLNLIKHADEFIGNSSAMLYEAPALNVKCRMIGKRQQGRVAPTGDGRASERIKEVLVRCLHS